MAVTPDAVVIAWASGSIRLEGRATCVAGLQGLSSSGVIIEAQACLGRHDRAVKREYEALCRRNALERNVEGGRPRSLTGCEPRQSTRVSGRSHPRRRRSDGECFVLVSSSASIPRPRPRVRSVRGHGREMEAVGDARSSRVEASAGSRKRTGESTGLRSRRDAGEQREFEAHSPDLGASALGSGMDVKACV